MQRKLYSVLCGDPNGKEIQGRGDVYTCQSDSYSPIKKILDSWIMFLEFLQSCGFWLTDQTLIYDYYVQTSL